MIFVDVMLCFPVVLNEYCIYEVWCLYARLLQGIPWFNCGINFQQNRIPQRKVCIIFHSNIHSFVRIIFFNLFFLNNFTILFNGN